MRRLLACGVVALSLVSVGSPAVSADINFSTGISQSDFKSLSKDAGAAIGYRNLAATASLGISGFDISTEVSAMSINKNSAYWNSAFANDAPSFLVIPKVRARKGLPLGIGIGAMYAYVPDSNVKLYGAELSKSILEGTAATPAVGVRATYSKLSGVDDLDIQTYGIDASVSKGFVFITPYAGAGMMVISSEAKGNLKDKSETAGYNLKSETITVPRVFGGFKLSPLPLFSITAEAEYAVNPIYSLKAAIGF